MTYLGNTADKLYVLVFLSQIYKMIVQNIREHDSLIVQVDNDPDIITGLIYFLLPSLTVDIDNRSKFI